MTDNPIERLRNHLSPFLNLVSLLTLNQVKIESENPTLTKLIDNELRVCAENVPLIREYLDKSDTIQLNYDELKLKFNELLSTQTKEDLENWLEFDGKRMENGTGNSSED